MAMNIQPCLSVSLSVCFDITCLGHIFSSFGLFAHTSHTNLELVLRSKVEFIVDMWKINPCPDKTVFDPIWLTLTQCLWVKCGHAVTLNSILVEGQGDVSWKDLPPCHYYILDKLTYDLSLTFVLLDGYVYPFCRSEAVDTTVKEW